MNLRRVIVTRPRDQSASLIAGLVELGAEPVEVPVIAVADPVDGGKALRGALDELDRYEWLVVTSANGARRVLAEDPALDGVKVAAVGSKTAEVLGAAHVAVDFLPSEFVAEGFVAEFPAGDGRVLCALAEGARDVVPDGLRELGRRVDRVDCYRTGPGPITDEHRAAAATADVITFTSSSTVTHYLELVGPDLLPPTVVSIGPVTSQTLRANGIEVTAEAEVHDVDGLLSVLARIPPNTA